LWANIVKIVHGNRHANFLFRHKARLFARQYSNETGFLLRMHYFLPMNQVYRIAVIGSGTRGLAATTILSRDGRDVSVFERFDEPRPLGAGILLQPTGLACPACLGLDDETISRVHLF